MSDKEKINDLENHVEALKRAISSFVDIFDNCDVTVSSGCCMCGDDMARHASCYSCGHAPCDSGEYYTGQAIEEARKLIAKKEMKDDRK